MHLILIISDEQTLHVGSKFKDRNPFGVRSTGSYLVDKNNEIREEFPKFIYMGLGVRGEEQVKSKILETLRDAGIDMSYCRGQGYDGAAKQGGWQELMVWKYFRI